MRTKLLQSLLMYAGIAGLALAAMLALLCYGCAPATVPAAPVEKGHAFDANGCGPNGCPILRVWTTLEEMGTWNIIGDYPPKANNTFAPKLRWNGDANDMLARCPKCGAKMNYQTIDRYDMEDMVLDNGQHTLYGRSIWETRQHIIDGNLCLMRQKAGERPIDGNEYE